MKTLIFFGSPRKNGETAGLLQLLCEKIPGEYRLVDAYRSRISPCLDCRACQRQRGCVINDEMQEVYAYLKECDNVLIASPVYFSELTGPLLSVCSRLQTYYYSRWIRREEELHPKKGAVLLTGGGNGRPDKAYETAAGLLRLMNCREILPLAGSFRTDALPAREDARALEELEQMVCFFTAS